MAKGKIRTVTGYILLGLQAWAILMNPDAGFVFVPELWLRSVLYMLGYWGHGIVGFVLVNSGLKAKRTYEDVSVKIHAPQKGVFLWLRYVIAALLSGFCLVLAYGTVESARRIFMEYNLRYLYYYLLLTVAHVFMIVYLLFYAGRRPSHLLSAALGFAAAANGYFFLSRFSLETVPLTVCYLAAAGLYTWLGVYLLRPHRSKTPVWVLGVTATALTLPWASFGVQVDLGLVLAFFVYTVVAPLEDTTDHGGNENG